MHSRRLFTNRRSAFAIVTLVAALSGCSLTRAAYVYVQSPESLAKVSASLPIYAEKGAESMAGDISAALPTSIQRIEATHGGTLGALAPIVICATQACYEKYAAIPSSDGETLGGKRIAINGANIFKKKRDAVQLFTHELSHFYWFSQGIGFQPRWFEEGMGVWASNGGGAENVSVEAAQQAIRSGITIQPTLNSGLWNYLTQSPSPPENNWHMYYRQAGMFVQYLHDSDPTAFAHLLEALRNTKDLKQAWSIAYKRSLDETWLKFTKEIQGMSVEKK